jgi:hypothetical protein
LPSAWLSTLGNSAYFAERLSIDTRQMFQGLPSATLGKVTSTCHFNLFFISCSHIIHRTIKYISQKYRYTTNITEILPTSHGSQTYHKSYQIRKHTYISHKHSCLTNKFTKVHKHDKSQEPSSSWPMRLIWRWLIWRWRNMRII